MVFVKNIFSSWIAGSEIRALYWNPVRKLSSLYVNSSMKRADGQLPRTDKYSG
jgi:hypothetical protein